MRGVSDPDGAVPSLDGEEGVMAAYRQHGAEVYRFALRGLADPGAAQDVTQETFVKAWRSAHRYDPDTASLRVWLFGIARNTMIDHLRADRARPWQSSLADAPTIEASAGSVEDHADTVLDGWLVEEGMRRLAPHHREALVQTHLLGRPYDEVAAELSIPVGTLRSRVFYAMRALRSAMDEMGVSL
jgi:RNA polymerase sigma-70 factor, ECF subfamily